MQQFLLQEHFSTLRDGTLFCVLFYFKILLSSLSFSFAIVCFSETWFDDFNMGNKFARVTTFASKQQVKIDHKEGGVSVYVL